MGRGWARRLRALLAVGIVVSSEAGAQASDDQGQGHVRAVRLLCCSLVTVVFASAESPAVAGC